MRRLSALALAASSPLAVLGFAGQAQAHPHVFAEARLEVTLNPDETVKSLRHVWRFDDVFSATVVMEFDKNGDLKLDDAEMADVSKTIFESLGEYGYFQVVTADGKDVAMKPPAPFVAQYQDDRLIVLFESEPAQPLKLRGKLDFGIYDPSFYTAIDFTDDKELVVENLPHRCTHAVIRPDPDEAIAQNQATLTEAFFNDPSGTDMSKIFATRLELNCAA
ncbi:MAG: DUF1007 family protein [Methylobacterium mesophilicum]|nr:DUF1007 family protein [Methylobacterium mesophilicum]